MTFTASLADIVERNENGLLSAHTNWCRVSLDQVAAILNGFPFPSAQFTNEAGTPLVRIRDILSSETETYFNGEYDPNFLIEPGDLVVGMDGDFNSTLWRGRHSLLNQRVCKLTPNEDFYRKKLLAYVLPGYLRGINAETSSVTVKHLSSNTIAEIPLPLPPLPEQDRIVGEIEKQFTRLDAAVVALRRTQANLRRYRAAVLKAACEGCLVPNEAELASREGRSYEPASAFLERILVERREQFETSDRKKKYGPPEAPDMANLKALPEGWTWASLDQLFVVERGRFSIRPRNDPNYYGGQHPFVQIGDLPREGGPIRKYQQSLNDRGLAVSRIFRAGTVLIAIVGATIANTGVLTFDSCCPDSLVAFQGSDKTLLQYAELYMRSVKLILRRASYASGGQPNINLGTLQPYPVPLPPYQELRRIVFELDHQFSIIEELESQVFANLKRADRLRQAVLRHAFEGKLVPQDPSDEPASALLERIHAAREAAPKASLSRGRWKKEALHVS